MYRDADEERKRIKEKREKEKRGRRPDKSGRLIERREEGERRIRKMLRKIDAISNTVCKCTLV